MGYTLLNITAFALLSFLVMYFIYKPVMQKFAQTMDFKFSVLVFPYVVALYGICSLGAYFTTELSDFVEPLTIWRVLLPLAFAVIIYGASLLFSGISLYAVVAVALGITVWMQPLGIGNAFALDSLWLRCIVFIGAFIFCLGNRILNILPHTFVLPNIIILAGLSLLALMNASPLYIAVCAAALVGILSAYLSMNYYNVIVDLDDGACIAISYLVCNLLLMNLGEFCLPSCLIFTAIFWAELLTSIYNRVLITHLGFLRENTNYYFAAQRCSLQFLTSSILKTGLVLLFISWFQLFSINQYSLLLIALFIILWLNGILGRNEKSPSTLSDINRKFISDLKQNLQEAKDIFTFNKKDKS